MNGSKLVEIRQKVSSMKFVERKSREPATEFSTAISGLETAIQRNIQEVEQERRNIERNFLALKTPTDTTLEIISFPDAMTTEGNKILTEQSETLRQLVAEQVVLEKNLDERQSLFATKKAELHKKFLHKKAKGR